MPPIETNPNGQPEGKPPVPEASKPAPPTTTPPENTPDKPVAEKKNSELTSEEIRELSKEELHERLYGKKKEGAKEAAPSNDKEKEQKKPDAKQPEGSDEDDLDISNPDQAKAKYRELKKELATRTKQTEDQKVFVNKQGNEIGEMRKIITAFNNMLADPAKAIDFLKAHLPGANAAPKQGADNAGESAGEGGDYLADLLEGKPDGFIKALQNPQVKDHLLQTLDTEFAKRQSQALERENIARKTREENEANVKVMIPEYDEIENDILGIMKDVDGMTPEMIEHYKTNKFSKVPQDIIYHYSMRAKDARTIKQLKEKIAQLESAPTDVLDQVDRLAKGGAMANTSGQAPAGKKAGDTDFSKLTDEQIRNMPTAEIRKHLEKFKNRK